MEGEKAGCCSSRQHRSALAQGRQVQDRDPGQASTLARLNKPLPVCCETWWVGGAVDSKAVSTLTSSLTEEQPQEPARPVPCGRRRWEGAPSTEQGRGAGTRGVKVTKESFLEEVSLAFDKSVPGCMTHVQRASHP